MKALNLSAVFVFALLIIIYISALSASPCFSGGESYTFYTGDTSKSCREIRTSSPYLKKLFLSDVCGESAEYEVFDLDRFLEKTSAEIIFTEKLADSVNYYCKADLPYSVTLYGEEINLHICVREKGVKVGSPIIFGGY